MRSSSLFSSWDRLCTCARFLEAERAEAGLEGSDMLVPARVVAETG